MSEQCVVNSPNYWRCSSHICVSSSKWITQAWYPTLNTFHNVCVYWSVRWSHLGLDIGIQYVVISYTWACVSLDEYDEKRENSSIVQYNPLLLNLIHFALSWYVWVGVILGISSPSSGSAPLDRLSCGFQTLSFQGGSIHTSLSLLRCDLATALERWPSSLHVYLPANQFW